MDHQTAAQADPSLRSGANRTGAAAGYSGPLRYLAVGGGALPESTEVSLEQDLALAFSTLPGPGEILFAGGPGSRAVRVLDDPARIDERSLRLRLGDLFAPRPGRRSVYRTTTLPVTAAATLGEVEVRLRREFQASKAPPLLLYVATHGEQGAQAADNHAVLWAGEPLDGHTLAALHDGATRPLHAVVTSCFSGGFAELAFAGGDAAQGPTRAPRCGLFAGPWDRQTSGCDPNPDRRMQESYGLHMLNALRGRGRDGHPVPLSELDYDGDGRIGLLEAHSRARIAAMTIDVPTTTSERFLREVQTQASAATAISLPEEQAVATALGAELGLTGREAGEARLHALRAELESLDATLAEAEARVDTAYWQLSALILGRYPELDDPFHPRFETTLAKHEAPIAQLLDDTPEAREYEAGNRALGELDARMWQLQIREARALRYVRALETLGLAAALKARGGSDWVAYQRLLACERSPYGP